MLCLTAGSKRSDPAGSRWGVKSVAFTKNEVKRLQQQTAGIFCCTRREWHHSHCLSLFGQPVTACTDNFDSCLSLWQKCAPEKILFMLYTRNTLFMCFLSVRNYHKSVIGHDSCECFGNINVTIFLKMIRWWLKDIVGFGECLVWESISTFSHGAVFHFLMK